MDRNSFAFATMLVLGFCYLIYISANSKQQISYTVGQGLHTSYWDFQAVNKKQPLKIKSVRYNGYSNLPSLNDCPVMSCQSEVGKFSDQDFSQRLWCRIKENIQLKRQLGFIAVSSVLTIHNFDKIIVTSLIRILKL